MTQREEAKWELPWLSVDEVKKRLQWSRFPGIDSLREEVQGGNREALVEAVLSAASSGDPWPEWVRDEIAAAMLRYRDHYARTLDEAFAISRPSGYRQQARIKRLHHGLLVALDVHMLVQAGACVDDALFEAVGAVNKIGKTTASKYYYWHIKTRRIPPPRRDARTRDQLPPWLQDIASEVNWL